MSLAKALIAKQQQLGIPSILQLSKKIGVAYGSLYFLLQGKHAPNARTVGKYAKFLKVSATEVEAMASRGKGKGKGKAKKKGRKTRR
jgi:hypothetical protein